MVTHSPEAAPPRPRPRRRHPILRHLRRNNKNLHRHVTQHAGHLLQNPLTPQQLLRTVRLRRADRRHDEAVAARGQRLSFTELDFAARYQDQAYAADGYF